MRSARPRYFCSRAGARSAARSPTGSATYCELLGQLRRHRQHLTQQWIAGIAAAHPGDEAAGHPQAKAPAGLVRAREVLRAQAERGGELFRAGDRLGELLLPRPRLELAGVNRCRYHTRPL